MPLLSFLSELTRVVVGPPATPPKSVSIRTYAGAQIDRTTGGVWNTNTNADSEIISSLAPLRAASRALVRDNDYAKNALRIIANNVIGVGIGLQAQVISPRGQLKDKLNSQIERLWEQWCQADTCEVSGRLHFSDIERLLVMGVAESGEILVRIHRQPFGSSQLPLALEIIESDRLYEHYRIVSANGNTVRMGVEVDRFQRPVAYHILNVHPGDYQFGSLGNMKIERVPAHDIIHLYITERPGQTRGVPWFHTALRRLRNMGGLEEAEIVTARAASCIQGFIESPAMDPEPVAPDLSNIQNGQRILDMEPGMIQTLLPGEKYTLANPTRPNANLDPFMRLMLRGVAAGIGVSYESISRDYSQSNYSSSRLALLDDRDLWKSLQSWFIRNFRVRMHQNFIASAHLTGMLALPNYENNPAFYHAARFKPRGWTWVDPTKEVNAYIAAVRAGFLTVGDVIAQTAGGSDLEDILKSRRQELDLMEELDLIFDTDPEVIDKKGVMQPEPLSSPTETPTDQATEPMEDPTNADD